jgi:hypothetical protein
MARNKLTQGMASTDHILLGHHEVIQTNGSAPITSSTPSRSTAWEAWIQRRNHTSSSISATSRMPHVKAHTSDKITRRRAVAS